MREKVTGFPGDRTSASTGPNTAAYTVCALSERGLGATPQWSGPTSDSTTYVCLRDESMPLGKRSELPHSALQATISLDSMLGKMLAGMPEIT